MGETPRSRQRVREVFRLGPDLRHRGRLPEAAAPGGSEHVDSRPGPAGAVGEPAGLVGVEAQALRAASGGAGRYQVLDEWVCQRVTRAGAVDDRREAAVAAVERHRHAAPFGDGVANAGGRHLEATGSLEPGHFRGDRRRHAVPVHVPPAGRVAQEPLAARGRERPPDVVGGRAHRVDRCPPVEPVGGGDPHPAHQRRDPFAVKGDRCAWLAGTVHMRQWK
jgi:hypothetical protein